MLKINAQTGEIFVYDVIGEDWFGEGITADSITAALAELGKKKAIVRINSPGGSADEGIAIYNILKRHTGGVDTYNDSLAASAASVVFLAGDNRYAATGSRVMIHRAMTLDAGNATQLRKTADTLETYDKSLIEIYSQYVEKAPDEIMSLLDAETWYGSEDSVAMGFATAMDSTPATKAKVASWFKNAPAAMTDGQSLRCNYDLAVAARSRFLAIGK